MSHSEFGADSLESNGQELTEDYPPGIISQLDELGEGAIIFERGLANLFDRHPASIKRAVDRGELPVPVRLLGQAAWTAGVLLRFLEDRQIQAAKEKKHTANKIAQLSP